MQEDWTKGGEFMAKIYGWLSFQKNQSESQGGFQDEVFNFVKFLEDFEQVWKRLKIVRFGW